MPTERLSIVMACDEGYAMPLTTTLRSVVTSNTANWPLNVHVLTDGLCEETKERILSSLPIGSVSIRWLLIDLARFADLETLAHVSQMTFARLVLSDLIPPAVRRVLYLDSDLLVLGDLTSFWNMPLEESCIAAVLDSGLDPLIKQRDTRYPGIPLVANYFNAGVLLIDLVNWRERKVGEAAFAYLLAHPKTPFADQDALNVVLEEAWLRVPEEWNFQVPRGTGVSHLKPSPTVVHFITEAKPWKYEYNTPNQALFDSYRRQTKFYRNTRTRMADSIKTMWVLLKKALRQVLGITRSEV